MGEMLSKALLKFESARPRSGFRPETEEEWARLQDAMHDWFVALHVEQGMPEPEARRGAAIVWGGAAGRLLLDIGFRESHHDKR